jgi:2-methylcitrate dehydratase PrpD
MLMETSAPHSRRLAHFLCDLRIEALPLQAPTLLKACLLDTIGCALGGWETDAGGVIGAMLRRADAGSAHIVIGHSGRASAETATLANGMLAHALVFDDLHRHAKLHPGVATIPAALAAAELHDVDGNGFLSALAVGYETVARVGVAIDMASHRNRGWRATGTAGSFGAAAAAAHILGLNADSLHHALAAAAAQASGNWAFQQSGGMELYLAAGTAARNGVTSALLAEAGFRGAADPLTAKDGGFFGLTSDAANPALITEGLGSHHRLLDTCIKMYPTCHSSQTAIDAAMNLRQRYGIGPDDVERTVVRAGEITRVQCGWAYEPAPPAKLIFHMGYAMAVALRNGAVRPSDFEGSSPHDPQLVRLASATEVVADPALTAIYSDRKPSDVTMYLRDGRVLHEHVEYCRGEPENPPTTETVVAKFRDIGAGRLSNAAMDEIADRVLHLERETSLVRLRQLLTG